MGMMPSVHGEILSVANETIGYTDSTAVLDYLHGFAYFSAQSHDASGSHADILKIRLSDFKHIGTLTLPDDIGSNLSLLSAVLDPANSTAYFGTNNGKVMRVSLSDFSTDSVTSLTVGEPGSYVSSAVIDLINSFAYFVENTTVVKIRLSDFTETSSLTLGQESSVSSALIDTSVGFAYFGGQNSTGSQVERVRLSDFTLNGTLTLNPGESFPYGSPAIIDGANGFAYFGIQYFGTTSVQQIVRIRLSDFSEAPPFLKLDGADGYLQGTAAIDTAGGIGYFAASGSNGVRLVEVRLSDLMRAGSLSFGNGFYVSSAAVVDPANGYAYFGGANYLSGAAAIIIRVRLGGQNQPPIAVINPSFTFGLPLCLFPCFAGQPITFNASSSFDLDGNIVEYRWDFGDGSSALGSSINHTYASGGRFVVTLTVADDKGTSGSTSKRIQVQPLTEPTPGIATGYFAKYAVSANDTTFPFVPSFIDRHGTVMTTMMKVTGVDKAKLTIEWQDNFTDGTSIRFPQSTDVGVLGLLFTGSYSPPPPRSNLFVIRPNLKEGDLPWLDGATFTPSGITGTGQEALFGDKRSTVFVDLYEWFGNSGKIHIQWDKASGLLIHASASFDDYYSDSVKIDEINLLETNVWQANKPPSAGLSWKPSSPSAGQPITFDASGSVDTDGTIVNYQWDFGDGTTGVGIAPTHTFPVGTFTVRLTVEDDDGATSQTLARQISVSPRLTLGLTLAGAGAATVAAAAIASSFIYLRKMRRQNRTRPSPPPTL